MGGEAASIRAMSKATAHNRMGWDYREKAQQLGSPVVPIIDMHSHIGGRGAALIYREVRAMFGVSMTASMSPLADAEFLKDEFGDSIRFIAMPEFMNKDRAYAHGPGYIDVITRWHRHGARIVKFWVAPRGRDLGRESGDANILTLTNPWRLAQMDHAASLGMAFMVHVADPDTWFATKYSDPAVYGTKRSHYEPLERLIERYRGVPWILAHMGGWPEDLAFLSALLTRHPNVCLDTSATKWIVREVSRHEPEAVRAFVRQWRGRLMFGSDIVTTDRHLTPDKSGGPAPMGDLASSPEEAFELYASRYWALRTLWETAYDAKSSIADPDLMMVEPQKYDAMSAPRLRGVSLAREELEWLYRRAAEAWWARLPGSA